MRTRPVLVFVVGLAVVVVACGGSPSEVAEVSAEEVLITIENFDFGDSTKANVGDTIRISNKDGVAHTWTSDSEAFNSGSIGPGGDFTFTFDEPGNYEFFCSIHPSMTGSISISG